MRVDGSLVEDDEISTVLEAHVYLVVMFSKERCRVERVLMLGKGHP
jgi:hypothetical protein